MRVLGFDLETTGLDPVTDRIVELGWCLWDVDSKKPLEMANEICYDYEQAPIPEETVSIHGITNEMAEEFGSPTKHVICRFLGAINRFKPDYLVAHNGHNFDLPFIKAETKRQVFKEIEEMSLLLDSIPLIDTRTDLPFDVEPASRKLAHVALDQGFINPFPHRALFDVMTMLKVLSSYDIAKIIEYQKIPWIIVRAMVSYEERELAKAQRYYWQNVGDKTFPKAWVKAIKANQLEKEQKTCPFQVIKIE